MSPRRPLGRAWVIAGLVTGAVDLAAAFTHAGAYGVPPARVLRTIASGVLGRTAFDAGNTLAAPLGALLHFVIAFGAAGTYLLASRRLAVLRQRPWLIGPLYGIAVYWFMQLVVLPLSAGTFRAPSPLGRAVGLAIHVVCVGLPIALCTARLTDQDNEPGRDASGYSRSA